MIRALLLCGVLSVESAWGQTSRSDQYNLAQSPMTEERCHTQRGEWVPHVRQGGFGACAFGDNSVALLERLDRIEATLRALCENTGFGSKPDCPKETKP